MTSGLGQGGLRYELVEDWEQLPAGVRHADVSGVCTDSSGKVYVLCRGELPVLVYDRDGHFLHSWGRGEFSYRTHAAYMTPDDELLIVDDDGHSVGRYSPDGRFLGYLGPAGVSSDSGYDGADGGTITHAAGPYNRPTGVCRAPSGDYYVSDGYGNCAVHRFDPAGALLHSWGEPGSGPGQFRIPHGIWVHTDGRVFVADRQNDRIQIFDPDGNYLTEWTDVQRPQSIHIDRDGVVYVAELVWRAGERSSRRGPIEVEEPARLSIFDPVGDLLLRWSGDSGKPGSFAAPHGIWVDDEGAIYVAEVTDTICISRGYAAPTARTLQKFTKVR